MPKTVTLSDAEQDLACRAVRHYATMLKLGSRGTDQELIDDAKAAQALLKRFQDVEEHTAGIPNPEAVREVIEAARQLDDAMTDEAYALADLRLSNALELLDKTAPSAGAQQK